MMSRLWNMCGHKNSIFLFWHTMLGMLYGICAWSVVSLFALKSVTWMLCFAGYGAFFFGFLGGVWYIWQHTGRKCFWDE